MIFDLPPGLLIAYGLIALLVLGAALLFWWIAYNTRGRREARSRRSAHYRQQAAAEPNSDIPQMAPRP